MSFSEFGFHPSVLEGITAMGFQTPTPIQQQAMPLVLSGHDLIACAQTGTGKTAAFILPLLSILANRDERQSNISTLIIVPTRELAIQIDQQIEGFAYFSPASSIAVYGGSEGASWDKQRAAIESGVDFLVATPGRLIQHLKMGYVKLDKVEHLVLDEADRMLDMGFLEDIMEIVAALPKKRQTLMFSATMPNNIRKLARQLLVEPREISLSVSKPAENVLQAVYIAEDNEKIGLLAKLLEGKTDVKSVIVFASTKEKVKSIERLLLKSNVKTMAIHSDLSQPQREEVLRKFRNRHYQVLVATNIVSRGIDIEDIDLVVNFDVPADPEDYVHRIGRTARAQNDGVAITFVSNNERRQFLKIEEFIGEKVFRIPTA